MSKQVGGEHYIRCSLQPWEVIERNELDFWEGNIVKYVFRYKHKNGLQDLLKAKHYLEYLINREEQNVQTITQERQFSQESTQGVSNLRGGSNGNSEISPYAPWPRAS